MKVMFPKTSRVERPFITASAGVVPKENHNPNQVSLDELVSNRNQETIYVEVDGDSMQDRNINHGDVLIVHVRPTANSGETILARFGDTFTVKDFHELEPFETNRRLYLVPANSDYKPKAIEEPDDFEIIGVVSYVLKRLACMVLTYTVFAGYLEVAL